MDAKNTETPEAFSLEDIDSYERSIKAIIDEKLSQWPLMDVTQKRDYHDTIMKITDLFCDLHCDLFLDITDEKHGETLHKIVFNKIHDIMLPSLKAGNFEQDLIFFQKCKILCDMNVNAEHFGADENYSIPLTAAIVELSILDNYKSPMEKINCLCATYDLLFAELKTAIVAMISKNSEREDEFPVVENEDVMPILMTVIIKSKLCHMYSNINYIKYFYYTLPESRHTKHIFDAFERATEEITKTDVKTLNPANCKIQKTLDLQEIMRMMSVEDKSDQRTTLVDEEYQRILSLITRSTSE